MKRKTVLFLVVLLCFLISGCVTDEKREDEMYVYYLNADGNGLTQKIYPKMDVEAALDKLITHSVLPKNVQIVEYKLERNRLSVFFNNEYTGMNKSTEVLVRAAIVQTMTQIDGIDFLSFYVGKEPLKNKDGNPIGLMSAQDFVQNIGSSFDSYQTMDLKLYFADRDGKQLKEMKKTNIHYDANTSVEKIVVEQLMKGSTALSYQSVIPKTTKLLGVSVKDNICYVNFDSKFSTDSYDLDPQVTIYAIVNSIIANGNVKQVQILIDGASDIMYKNQVDISQPFEWSYDLIQE